MPTSNDKSIPIAHYSCHYISCRFPLFQWRRWHLYNVTHFETSWWHVSSRIAMNPEYLLLNNYHRYLRSFNLTFSWQPHIAVFQPLKLALTSLFFKLMIGWLTEHYRMLECQLSSIETIFVMRTCFKQMLPL
jgi:hypothetical protein